MTRDEIRAFERIFGRSLCVQTAGSRVLISFEDEMDAVYIGSLLTKVRTEFRDSTKFGWAFE